MLPARISRIINICSLIAAILIVLVFPFKKYIWYDEFVSVMCSKGISYDTKDHLAASQTISSANIDAYNNVGQIFHATVLDNSNSFPYNIGLHFFSLVCGNSLTAYILFSRLWGIAALIAMFCLARLLLGDSFFVSVAIILFCTDIVYWSMANEIRAYAMAIFFTTMAALSFFRYRYKEATTRHLFQFALWSVCAILCHFFTLYVIVVLAGVLLYSYRASLFTKKNLLALAIPLALLILYVICAIDGFNPKHMHTMILQSKKPEHYSIWEALRLMMKFTAINFKAVYPRLSANAAVDIASFAFVMFVFLFGIRLLKNDKTTRQTFALLFLLGLSSTLFLMVLSVKNEVYSSFYYRYLSFSTPFCSLFAALFLKAVSEHAGNKLLKAAFVFLLIVPPVFTWAIQANKHYATDYNQTAIAETILNEKVTRVEVPGYTDAFLLHCFLPQGYHITYLVNPNAKVFTLYNGNNTETIPAITKYPD